jgi:hypothetical protein
VRGAASYQTILYVVFRLSVMEVGICVDEDEQVSPNVCSGRCIAPLAEKPETKKNNVFVCALPYCGQLP